MFEHLTTDEPKDDSEIRFGMVGPWHVENVGPVSVLAKVECSEKGGQLLDVLDITPTTTPDELAAFLDGAVEVNGFGPVRCMHKPPLELTTPPDPAPWRDTPLDVGRWANDPVAIEATRLAVLGGPATDPEILENLPRVDYI